MNRNSEYLHDAPISRRFIIPPKLLQNLPGPDLTEKVTIRCGLCGWSKQTTRGEFPGLHAEHRAKRHA